jgi:hypothetical protein
MSSPSRGLYRTRQFAQALRPRLSDGERQEARRVLGDGLVQLFDSMTVRDRRHCFDVYRALLARGCSDSDVLMAALLHDAGKGRLAGAPVHLWHRVAYVLLATAAPALLGKVVASGRGGLASLRQHSARGAALAEAFAAPSPVVELIARHEDAATGDERLRLLRIADDSC